MITLFTRVKSTVCFYYCNVFVSTVSDYCIKSTDLIFLLGDILQILSVLTALDTGACLQNRSLCC